MTAARDVIVIGSGASATNAVYQLVQAGLSVLMLDVGNVDDRYAPLIPEAPFSDLRRTDSAQHLYFLGDEFEGVPFGSIRVGGQLTPPRRFIQRDTDRLTPLRTEGFAGFESLALGGLAAGWGAVAIQYDDVDLADFPIKHRDLAPHYEAVSARIGISGARDDLLRHYGDCGSLQPPLELDSNGEAILSRYEKIRDRLRRRGLYVGRPRLAVLSRDLGERRAEQYHDMDYYADTGRSVFRPAFLVEEMERFPRFEYAKPYLVERFRERKDGVEVEALHVGTGAKEVFTGRKLILAAGVMGTARIVLRSLERYDTPVPIVTNPGTYVPCIHLAMLGKEARDRRHSLTQLGAILETDGKEPTRVYAEVHSYRSLFLFKAVKESFLPLREGFRVGRELLNAFVILVIHHEDRPDPGKHCILRRGAREEPDTLEVRFEPTGKMKMTARRQASDEKTLLRGFRKLGCWPVKRIRPTNGASLHYGGPLPMTAEERDLTVTPECLLRGTRSVYIADGSVLPYLPAKASTLTLMANADRVGTHVLRQIG